ncbi:MAG: hypothetical protein U9R74_17205 [Pseudomonadota bacterium]|nr:hypothetical protein [Pseudomonadota bacterium]
MRGGWPLRPTAEGILRASIRSMRAVTLSNDLEIPRPGRAVCLALALAASTNSRADSPLPENFQIHAFAAQNAIITSANNLFGDTDNHLSFDFREVGVNGSWRPRNNILLAAQGTYRLAGSTDDGSVRLDYGLIDYAPLSTPDYKVGVRAGRLLNPLGFYNETRDVAFTRPSILLPQSIYFDRTRDLALSADGGQFYGDYYSSLGDFFLQAGVGFPRAGATGVEGALLGFDFPGELKGEPSFLGRLLYERDGGRLRLALSGALVNLQYEPAGVADPLPAGDITFTPIIFSAQYNAEKWSLTSEFGPRGFSRSGFGQAPSSTVGESAYVEGLYRFTPKWEAFLRYDVLFTDGGDRDGKKFQAQTGLPNFFRFAKDVTVGGTWRINRWALARAEYHYVNGTAWLPLEDNTNLAEIEQYWSVFALQIALRY